MNHSDLSTSTGPTPDVATTAAAIDREMSVLAAALAVVIDPDEAVDLERRRQQLLAERSVALVRERVERRQQSVVRAQACGEAFTTLEAELVEALHEAGVNLDGWIEEGASLTAHWNAVVERLVEVMPLLDSAAANGREVELRMAFGRFGIAEPLERALVAARVLAQREGAPSVTAQSIAAVGQARGQQFFAEARTRLPQPHETRTLPTAADPRWAPRPHVVAGPPPAEPWVATTGPVDAPHIVPGDARNA